MKLIQVKIGHEAPARPTYCSGMHHNGSLGCTRCVTRLTPNHIYLLFYIARKEESEKNDRLCKVKTARTGLFSYVYSAQNGFFHLATLTLAMKESLLAQRSICPIRFGSAAAAVIAGRSSYCTSKYHHRRSSD
jgi:hypothetical protein